MAVALITHEDCIRHEMGSGHPECPERLQAVLAGLEGAHLASHMAIHKARTATREELARVHPDPYVDAIESAAPEEGYSFLSRSASTRSPI